MPTCKDCLHVDVCKKMMVEAPEVHEPCQYFKDRSKFVELPCKVGDVFYGVDTYGINAYSCYGVGYGYVSKNKLGFLLFTVGHREYIFGEEAFLTEAEAEKSKERDNFDPRAD